MHEPCSGASWGGRIRTCNFIVPRVLRQPGFSAFPLCRRGKTAAAARGESGKGRRQPVTIRQFPDATSNPGGISLADAFAILCDRCDTGLHLPGDTLCADCRTEVDAAFGGLAGAEG
jgi:hypothetical protein